MSFPAELRVTVVVWLSSVGLEKVGITRDTRLKVRPVQERTVSRSPRKAVLTPVAMRPDAQPATVA